MKFLQSNLPEVSRGIKSSKTRASRYLSVLLLGLLPNLFIVSVGLLYLIVSERMAVWVGVLVLLVWNIWALWRARSSRFSWLIKTSPELLYIHLAVRFGSAWRGVDVPDILAIEPSEIASVSIRTVEVFLYGPKPRVVEWLMINPIPQVAENIPGQMPPFLGDTRTPKLSERIYWDNEKRRLAVGWKRCRPDLRVFLQQIIQEYPSITIGSEDHSELDLNDIWRGSFLNLDQPKRRLLAQAVSLGFRRHCGRLLCRYKYISFLKAAAYLAEVEREDAGAKEHPGS